ncbi:hypothetical protein Lal_00041677 [Lupinus albus]|nr:hypothetical protein Lal_00041677 [Lupinus albus]
MSMVSELFSAANKMTPFRAHGGPDRRELLFLFGFDDLVASMAARLELRNGSEEEGELEVQDETRVCETESVVVNIRPRRSVSLDSSSVANVNLVLANVQSSVQSGENEGIVSKRFIAGNENFPTTSNSKRSSSFRTRYLHSVLFFLLGAFNNL